MDKNRLNTTKKMLSNLFQKATHKSHSPESPRPQPQTNMAEAILKASELDPRVVVHYGIPSTASILAFDPIQSLLAIGTLDGRIKVIGGGNIEAILISPKQLPFKNLEFLQNQGFLISVSNENEIQVWDLENRFITCDLQWESNITAFSVICGTNFMYVGDEYGFLYVLKYDIQEGNIKQLPYHIPPNLIAEAAEISLPDQLTIVSVLSQPNSSGNRVLIAYQNGLIILWDVAGDRAVLVRGYKELELQVDCVVNSKNDVNSQNSNDTSDHEQTEKEISSVCWVSSDGSILAVGYVDGDILLWNLSIPSNKNQLSQKSTGNVVKLLLSSGDRRLPVIVLHWSSNRSQGGQKGQLFVYGGDDIGSEEVLTILTLEWSSGIATLKCTDRVDLTLNGSFADLILISSAYGIEYGENTSLFILTNPGQLHFYDNTCLSTFKSEPKEKHLVTSVQYPATIPTTEPQITVGKFYTVAPEGALSKALLETVSDAKLKAAHSLSGGTTRWPLTGGVPSELSFVEDKRIKSIYIAGYQDGSLRIWDASFPVLSLLSVLEFEVEGIEIPGSNASVTALTLSSNTLSLAVGNEHGLVQLHRLVQSSEKTSLHFVTEAKNEAYDLPSKIGFQCSAVFSLLDSPVRALQFVTSGARLAVGFECGRVGMLDLSSSAVLFCIDCLSSSRSPVVSLATGVFQDSASISVEQSEMEPSNESAEEVAVVMTKDAHLCVIDGASGNKSSSSPVDLDEESTGISMYILEPEPSVAEGSEQLHPLPSQNWETKDEPLSAHERQTVSEVIETSDWRTSMAQKHLKSLVLLCCEHTLLLYSLKSVLQGAKKPVRKINLVKPCSWTSIIKRDGKESGLIMVYQTGSIEIRSLPDLEVVGETSLMSTLRLSFKTNMDKTMSSSDEGLITLVNGCEFAVLSLFSSENDFRNPGYLPCLHDKVLAAAANAAIDASQNQKKKEVENTGIFGGIIKGIKGVRGEQDVDFIEARETVLSHLECIFSRFPFSDTNTADDLEDLALSIDDIEIDEPVPVTSSFQASNSNSDQTGAEKETERERLFEGGSGDTKPRLRTREEIMAKYRKAGDANSAAAQAKDKLLERQEKLEKLSRRTEELQSGAENFASLANELAKTMEKRKWWNI